ncbi:MAG: hypothetical protein CSA26_03225 [Desulfobacterales bacterium]|nr:MAG: hypothetical protein CSA26_03225 [Desulfobacterales bacterium]
MLSGPITSDLGEILAGTNQGGVEISGFSFTAYLYNGEADKLDEEDSAIDKYQKNWLKAPDMKNTFRVWPSMPS